MSISSDTVQPTIADLGGRMENSKGYKIILSFPSRAYTDAQQFSIE